MDSIFTRIINGKIPCYKIAEDEKCFAFLDISPLAKGHTLVVPKIETDYIFDIADDEVIISEEFIKQIHEVLLLEPYEIESVAIDGKPVKKLVGLGKYKETPNHIINKTHEVLHFATPKETPARMKELIERFEAKRDEAGDGLCEERSRGTGR